MTKRTRNHPVPAIAALLVGLGAFAWQGWQGFVIAFVAFMVGGIGTAFNAARDPRFSRDTAWMHK